MIEDCEHDRVGVPTHAPARAGLEDGDETAAAEDEDDGAVRGFFASGLPFLPPPRDPKKGWQR